MDAPAKTPQASRVTMTEIVLPADTNNYGHIFGGRLLALADKCAAMTAMRHCRQTVVTASFDRVDFVRPVKAGNMVMLTAEVNAAFRSSLEVGVVIETEVPLTGERETACRALITMVAVDASGKPTAVPPLACTTPEEAARAERAAQRRVQRLSTRGAF